MSAKTIMVCIVSLLSLACEGPKGLAVANYPLVRDTQEVINPSSGLCLDSFGQVGSAQMYGCHGRGGNQNWEYDSSIGELRNPVNYCLDSYGRAGTARVEHCHELRGNQEWLLDDQTGELKNHSSGLCLDSSGSSGDAMVAPCDGQQGNQYFELTADSHEFWNPSTGLCLESFGEVGSASMQPCDHLGTDQKWELDTNFGELRNTAYYCLDSLGQAGSAGIHICDRLGGNQQWVFNAQTGELKNPSSGLCLDSWGHLGDAIVASCHGQQGNQRFTLMLNRGLRYCASEGAVCNFDGVAKAYFGIIGSLTSNSYTGSVPCTTTFFYDPVPGASKDCWVETPDRFGSFDTTLRPLSPSPASVSSSYEPVLTAASVTDVSAGFVADPFLYYTGSSWYLFMEVLNKSIGRGQIAVARSSDGLSWTYDRIVLAETFHLSFPYVFSFNGRYYMVPETGQAQSVRLYETVNFPYDWHNVATLVSGRAYVDSTITYHGSRWWLFASYAVNTFLFSSPDLFGPWVEHPKSPIVRADSSRGRPGGRIIALADGSMYRFVQKDDVSYGERVRAFQIDTLTETDFGEHEVDMQPPVAASGSGWNAAGMHTFDPWWTGSKWVASVDGVQQGVWSIGIYTIDPANP